jgi:hypothetical protein
MWNVSKLTVMADADGCHDAPQQQGSTEQAADNNRSLTSQQAGLPRSDTPTSSQTCTW